MAIGGLTAGIINLLNKDEGGLDQLKKASRLWKNLQLPEFDTRALAPPELSVIAEYFPTLYDSVIQQGVEVPQDSPGMRGVQLQNLADYGRIRDEGLPLAERAVAEQYQNQMSDQARRVQQSVLQNLAARGRLGGGDEMAGRMIANQQSSNLARAQGDDLARYAVENRLRALQEGSQLSTGIRAQDFGVQTGQANAMNRFNEWVSALGTQVAAQNAGNQQAAAWQNVGRAQQVGDQNVMQNYLNQIRNQEYPNMMAQQGYQNELSRVGGYTNALTGQARGEYAQAEAERQAIQGVGQGVDGSLLSLLSFTGGGQNQQQSGATRGRI